MKANTFRNLGDIRARAEDMLGEHSGTDRSMYEAASAASYMERSDVDIGEPSEPYAPSEKQI